MVPLALALVGLLGQHAFTAHGLGVDVLKNGTLVANNNASGITGNLTDPQTNRTQTFTATIPDSWGKTSELTPDPYYSSAYNAGYSHGYQGDNLTGHHTLAFFHGYFNGSKDFWYNKGYACGVSGKTEKTDKTFCDPYYDSYDVQGKQFHDGNNTGWKNRIDMLTSQYNNDDRDHLLQIVLPVNTTDGYKQYFGGFANGIQFYENRQSIPGPFVNAFTISCNGTAEYCTGFKAGWNEDEYNQD
jgi:hypothetical protein